MSRILLIIIYSTAFACANEKMNTSVTSEVTDSSSFPDSTNLRDGIDSIIFIDACIELGRVDIAERFYWDIIQRRDMSVKCRGRVDKAYIGLAYLERAKELPDTNLIFEYLDSANSACSNGDAAWSRANILFEYSMDSVEYYLNVAYNHNFYIEELSSFINYNINSLDTTKIEFDWMH